MTQLNHPDTQPERGWADEVETRPETASEFETAAQPQRQRFTSSVILRVLIITVAVVAVIGLVILIAFNRMRADRSQPIEIDVYPGAVLLNESRADNADQRNYAIRAEIEAVYRFYTERLGEMPYRTAEGQLGEDRDRGCRRIYDSETPILEPGRYFVRCFMDNSQDDLAQTLLITITYNLSEQLTLLRIERRWGGSQ